MFKVSSPALRAAAHDYTVGANQVLIAAKHHRDSDRLEFPEGTILGTMESSHRGFADSMQRRLDEAARVLADGGLRLSIIAKLYDAANADALRAMDPAQQ